MMPPLRDHTGETLVELLVSIAILGTASAGVISMVIMGTAASRTQQEVTGVDRILRNWGEELERQPYEPCQKPAQINALPDRFPPERVGWSFSDGSYRRTINGKTYTGTIQRVRYWDVATGQFVAQCDEDRPDEGLQEVTLSMQVVGAEPEQLVTVKRGP